MAEASDAAHPVRTAIVVPTVVPASTPRPGWPSLRTDRTRMSVHEVDCRLESMDSVLALLGELDDSDWQAPSLCPAWRVLQVVAHLDGIEEALSGWRPAGDAAAPFEIAGKVFDEVDDWSPHQLLSRLRTVLSFRRSELLAVD